MYRLLIVDDEPIVREGLKLLLDWEELGFVVCAEGIDGKDGLNKIIEFSPDLVLADIRMPGLGGLEMLKEAKKKGFSGKTIILTGYSDFEYAKSAVSLGVKAYLVKPIDEDELKGQVLEVREELDAKKNQEDFYSLSEIKARKELTRRLLRVQDNYEKFKNEIKLYGIDLGYNSFCVVLIRMKDHSLDRNEIAERMNYLLRDVPETERIDDGDKEILIIKGEEESTLESLRRKNVELKERFKDEAFICVGQKVANWSDIPYSFETACFLADFDFAYGDKTIVSIEDISQGDAFERRDFSKNIVSMLEIGDNEETDRLTEELMHYCKKVIMKESEIKLYISQTLMEIKNALDSKYPGSVKNADGEEIEKQIFLSTDLNAVKNHLMIFFGKLCDEIGNSGKENVAMKMYTYLEKNYEKDMRLEDIAKLFNYNSAYLGKIFKSEIGDSFNNVRDKIRIENAKRLLSEGKYKVYQVSEMVGFANIDYFYLKFKKVAGISPKEFQKINKEKE